MTLYIDCCARQDSRTRRLARAVLDRLGEREELYLYKENLPALSEKRLAERERLLASGALDAPEFSYARQWANADNIVIAAPYWDLSFPSVLKTYIENIYITGIVSRYGEDGRPVGLCRAQRLYYVTTAGGPLDERYGYGYLESLATDYFGIKGTVLIKAEMLDVVGFDAEKIMRTAVDGVSVFFDK